MSDDPIVDKELIAELRKYCDAYRHLSLAEKESFRVGDKPTSAKALADFMERLNPEQATYGQVKELIKFYYATQHIPAAKRVLEGFTEYSALFRSVSPPLAGLRAVNIHHVDEFLSQTEKSNVQQASRAFFHDDTRKNRLGRALLSHVIKGNQDTVVAMLKRYPELLLYRGNVVDYSGREFKNVTAFELATWALDVRHMAPAMLKCLTENEDGKNYSKELVPELQQQFDNVVKEDGGVNYTIGCGLIKMSRDPSQLLPNETPEQRDALLNRLLDRHNGCIQYDDRIFYFHNLSCPKKLVEITTPDAISALQGLMNKKEKKLEVDKLQIISHDDELKMIEKNVSDSRHIFKEKHYDFTPLTEALKVYVKSFHAGNNWTWDQSVAHWCIVVGLAQHYAPAHVAQHYCNPDESFDPQNNFTPPTFKENVLKRVLTFYNFISTKADKNELWWPSSRASGSNGLGPGIDIGILRGRAHGCAAPDMAWGLDALSQVYARTRDLTAVTAMCEVRKSEVPELKRRLDSLQKPDAGPEPAARCIVL